MLAWIFGDCRESQNRQGSDWQIFTTEETACTINMTKMVIHSEMYLRGNFCSVTMKPGSTADWHAIIVDKPLQLELSTDKGQKIWRLLCLRKAN